MEYHRTKTGQIYADIAYRLGKIVTQYEKLSVNEEKFEATLYVAILQNLLTTCSELLKHMTQMTRQSDSIFQKDIESVGWGLQKSCWVKNKYEEDLIMENFIKRVRNSISHPTETKIEEDYPSTGYTTIKDDSGIIKKFRFIDSPDTKRNRKRSFRTEQEISLYIRRNRPTFPENIQYSKNEQGYFLTMNSEPFIRIAIIDLSVEQLASFVKNLANYLAQPIQENWNGKTIKWLLAV